VSAPSVTVVVPAYNAEAFIADSLESVLGQTRPPDELIVVDDGSTDGTLDVVGRFGAAVRVIQQANQGHPGAYNTGFRAATSDYVARCDADDAWEPEKLERQLAAISADPRIDVAFCGARFFGLVEGPYGPPLPGGVLDPATFGPVLYRANMVCSSSVVIRRALFERIGPFVDKLPCEDYDLWLRAFAAGALFHYEPRELVRYRRHDGQVTHKLLRMQRATYGVHRAHADEHAPGLVAEVLADDLARIGRFLVDEQRPREARAAFAASLRRRPSAFALAWALLLSAPERHRGALIGASLFARRKLVVKPA
jgi:glycosyltransferase involved in cell wall biosynthesis